MPRVDVIVPCYRYGHFLRQCVTSVLAQSHRDLRVLIIDDASPDNTADVAHSLAAEDRRVSNVCHETNRGHIATYNEGLEWTDSDYLLLLSADDFLLPGALDRAVQVFDEEPHVGMTFGECIEVDDTLCSNLISAKRSNSYKRPAVTVMSSSAFIAKSGAKNIVPTPTAIVRTNLQKEIGGYRPELPHTGDMEMWFRFAARSTMAHIHVPQAVRRHHHANMSIGFLESLTDLKQRLAAIESFVTHDGDHLPDRTHILAMLRRSLAIDAIEMARRTFLRGDATCCDEMIAFGLALDPEIRKLTCWSRLCWTKLVDPRLWALLRRLVRSMRRDYLIASRIAVVSK